MKKRSHKILDHPILGYFILFVFAQIFIFLGSRIDVAASRFIPGYGREMMFNGKATIDAAGFGVAICSLVPVLLFVLWFKPDYKEPFSTKDFLTGILMILPCLLVHYVGSFVSIITFGTGSIFLAFLKSMAPGFSEEVLFRILGVSNYMRTIKSEDGIKKIFWLSSVFFGLFHLLNIFVGANIFSSVIQGIYAIGVGMALGAVYLRTCNIWVIILSHMSLDFLEFCRADLGSSGGIMGGMGIGDWITVIAGVVGAVIGLRLVNKKYYPEIMEAWNRKWSK